MEPSSLFLILLISASFSLIADGQRTYSCFVVDGKTCSFYYVSIKSGETVNLLAHHKNTTDQDIRVVSFDSSSIFLLPPEIFSTFPNVQTLKLGGQRVDRLQEDLFDNARNLKILHLNSNNIPGNIFRGAEELTEIYLFSNGITEVGPDAFKNLRKLEVLYLNDNKLTQLHPNLLSDSSQLRFIFLDRNEINFVPRNLFSQNLNLVAVHLQQNNIKAISHTMFSYLKSLDVLYLFSNNCINNSYLNASSKFQQIEIDLRNCTMDFLSQEAAQTLDHLEDLESKIDARFQKIDASIEVLKEMIGKLVEKMGEIRK